MGSVEVQGLSELRKTLLSLGGEIASKNGGPVRSALAKGARRVRDVARSLAPKETGRLQGAIFASRDKNPSAEGLTESYSVGVKQGNSREDLKGAFYWRFKEFGTAGLPPEPFLRPAFEQQKQGFADAFTEDLTKARASAVKKAAKNG